MAKVIIGIHGLSNKPAEQQLSDWWKAAIVEGLDRNCLYQESFNFDMVYWAGCIYKFPRHTEEHFPCDKLYNKEPYLPAQGPLTEHKKSSMDRARIFGRGLFGRVLDALGTKRTLRKLTKTVLEKMATDLDTYYSKDKQIHDPSISPITMQRARIVLQNRLRRKIRAHKNDEIMLIAHSMGSIIAYDVLRDMGMPGHSEEDEGIAVPYFVTIGSPLGLTAVKDNISRERDYVNRDDMKTRIAAAKAEKRYYTRKFSLRTPTIVTKSWMNFSDMGDIVAVDAKLSDEYKKNSSDVRVRDILVNNEYVGRDGESKNEHKSYGYLRAPEVSRHIRSFLES